MWARVILAAILTLIPTKYFVLKMLSAHYINPNAFTMEANTINIYVQLFMRFYLFIQYPCAIHVRHTEDDMAYLCSPNLRPLLVKCNAKFLEKYKGSLIFGSAYILEKRVDAD